jgi:hypothetical protein
MSEPLLPVPPPEDDGYHDPHPGRCPICRTILDVKPNGTGRCPEHGEVLAAYSFLDLKFETEEEERSAE